MNALILQSLCDNDFAVKSLGEYCKRKRDNFSKFISSLQTASDSETLEEAKQVIVDAGYNLLSEVMVGETYFTLDQLTTQIYDGIEQYAGTESETPTGGLNFLLTGANNKSISFGDVASSLQDQLYSISAMYAGCIAQTAPSFGEKMQVFRDTLTDVFSNAYSQGATVAEFYRNIFSQNLNSDQFIQAMASAINVSGQESALNSDDVVAESNSSDITMYTGASPAGALNFDSLGNAAVTVLTTGAKVMAGIYKSIGSLIGKGLSWVGKKIYQTVANPDDMYELENDSDYPTFDNLYWSESFTNEDMDIDPYFPTTISDEQCSAMAQSVQSRLNHWIKFNTIFSEVCFKFTSFEFRPAQTGLRRQFVASGQYCYAVKAMSPYAINTLRQALPTSGSELTYSNIASAVASFKDSSMYCTLDDEEADRAEAIMNGQSLSYRLAAHGLAEMLGMALPSSIAWQTYNGPDTVTNADFFYLATGKAGSTAVSDRWTIKLSVDRTWKNLSLAWMLGVYQQDLTPLDFPWIPYTNNVEPMTMGKWGIKTDAQNQDAFNNFMTTVIIVVIAVAASVVAGVAIRKVAQALFFKRTQTIAMLDNKMWQGQVLTPTERRQYLRAKRKLNASNILSRGLATSSSDSITQILSTQEDLSAVINLIN